MIRLQTPFPPSVNRLWRFNPKSGKAVRSYEYKAWREETGYRLREQIRKQNLAPHKGPYKITIRLVRPTGRHSDIDNRIKALLDALVTSRIVVDDRHCEHVDIRWVKHGPPCEVWISDPEPLTD